MESAIIVTYLVLFGTLTWLRPVWAVAGVIALAPLYQVRFAVGPLPMTLLECMILVLACVVLVQERALLFQYLKGIRLKKISLPVIRMAWCSPQVWVAVSMIALVVVALISAFQSPDLHKSLGIWRAYFLEPLVFGAIVLRVIKTERDVRITIWAVSTMVVGIAAMTIIQKITGQYIPGPWIAERRATGIFDYPNAVGLFVAPLIPLMVGLWLHAFKTMGCTWRRAVLIPSLFGVISFAFVAIVLAKTEAALVALPISLVVMGLLYSTKTRSIVVRVIILSSIVVAVTPGVQKILQEKLFLHDWSGQVRIITWHETVAMLHDHVMWGAGLAGYQAAMVPYHTAKFLEIFLYPHDHWLTVWSEMGLLGVGVWVILSLSLFALLGETLRHATKYHASGSQNGWSRILAIALIGTFLEIMVHGLVDVPYFKNDLAVHFWWYVALALIVYRATMKRL